MTDDTQNYGYVYLIGYAEFPGLCKIGFTKHLEARIETFKCASPFTILVIHAIKVITGQTVETQLHRKFKHKRVKREWFQLDTDDIAYIQSIPSEIDEFPLSKRDSDAIPMQEAVIKFCKLVASANDFSIFPDLPNRADLSSMNDGEIGLLDRFLTAPPEYLSPDEEIGYSR